MIQVDSASENQARFDALEEENERLKKDNKRLADEYRDMLQKYQQTRSDLEQEMINNTHLTDEAMEAKTNLEKLQSK